MKKQPMSVRELFTLIGLSIILSAMFPVIFILIALLLGVEVKFVW